MESILSDMTPSSMEQLDIKTISDSETSRLRSNAKESRWNTSRKLIGNFQPLEKTQQYQISDGTSSMGLTAKQKIDKQSSFGDIISVRSEFEQNLLAANQVDSNGLPKLKCISKG